MSPADRDRRLREEIRWLGDRLGEVLREQEGREAFDLVEEVRALSKARRAGDPEAEVRLAGRLRSLDLSRLAVLIQALSVFFDLANLAEDRHRVRVLRERERRRQSDPAAPPDPETLAGAAALLRGTGSGRASDAAAAHTSAGSGSGAPADRPADSGSGAPAGKPPGALLRDLSLEFVFTAHPTEAKRRSVREKVRDLRGHLSALDDPDLLPRERLALERRVKADLTGLWQTEFVRFRRPSVLEELDRSLFFAGNLWRVAPELYRELEEALGEGALGEGVRGKAPPLLRFGTWIGGDRDGNPAVTAEVTAAALDILRRQALARHIQRAREARGALSVSSAKAGVSEALERAIGEARDRWPGAAASTEHLSSTEPYRRWLRIVQWRLERAREERGAEGAYAGAADFAADLRLMRRSLEAHGGDELADAHLDDWIRQTEVFGLGLMRLDIRQESAWYHGVLGELLQAAGVHDGYARLDEAGRREVLSRSMPFRGPIPGERSAAEEGSQGSAAEEGAELNAAEQGGSGVGPAAAQHEEAAGRQRPAALSGEAREALALFRLLAATARTTGPEALGAQVISMTHQASDVLAVLWLMRWAAAREGLPDAHLPMAVAPLFETIDDLERAPEILDALLGLPRYRAHLRALGDRQIVMIGYSDSTKDGGYLAASWNLYDAQIRVQEPADRHGIALVFFHGRGGALGRGGGPAARHIMSLPPRSLRHGLRITEQGEVLAERYDDPHIARRHLEQVLSAVLARAGQGSDAAQGGGEADPASSLREALLPLAARAREAYRELVDHPGFMRYFEQATPITQIEELPIGSRPARRRAERSLETLRAIPWVFSWTQCRHLIPAWYGLGAAMEASGPDTGEGPVEDASGVDAASLERLRALYRESDFVRALVDNAALALAKADLGIARLHAGLVEEEEVREAIFGRIEREHARAVQAVLAVSGQRELLDDVPWLKRSIEVRNPYVDPLNMIQVELFRRLRAAREEGAGAAGAENAGAAGAGDAEPAQGEGPGAAAEIAGLIRLTIQGIAGGLRTTG